MPLPESNLFNKFKEAIERYIEIRKEDWKTPAATTQTNNKPQKPQKKEIQMPFCLSNNHAVLFYENELQNKKYSFEEYLVMNGPTNRS